jgi:hypothetical protein
MMRRGNAFAGGAPECGSERPRWPEFQQEAMCHATRCARGSALALPLVGSHAACAAEEPAALRPPTPVPTADLPRGIGLSGRFEPAGGVSPSGLSERYVLAESGAFSLEYRTSQGPTSYPGRYARADASDSTLTFTFDASGGAGGWRAEALLRGDTLRVMANGPMSFDFADGVYVRAP